MASVQVASNRVGLLPDCNDLDDTGFKELHWKLAERKLSVNNGMPANMFDGAYADKWPEDLSIDDL